MDWPKENTIFRDTADSLYQQFKTVYYKYLLLKKENEELRKMANDRIGMPDGSLPADHVLRAISGYADMVEIDISGADGTEIDLSTAIAPGAIGVAAINTSGSNGDLFVKTTLNTSKGYVGVPISDGQHSGVLARFTHIRISGSITSAIILFQLINQAA